MIALTVAAPSSTRSKSSSSVRTAGGFGVSRTRDPGGDPEHPLAADEDAAQVVAGRLGILAAEDRDVPSGSTTSTARTCEAVTP